MATPGLVPAHSLPLAHNGINFPLSIYLSGTAAIHAYLRDPPGLVDSVPWQTFRKVETHFEGEEEVDGLRCLKVRVNRWYQPNQPPSTQYLWLAPERNYHCIKEGPVRTWWYEMRVARAARGGARGLVPGANLGHDLPGERPESGGSRRSTGRTETTIEEVNLSPRHEAAFFRDVAIPAGLPIFTIKDRRLVGSMLPEPFDDDWGRQKPGGARPPGRRAGDGATTTSRSRRASLTTYPHTSSSIQNVQVDSR